MTDDTTFFTTGYDWRAVERNYEALATAFREEQEHLLTENRKMRTLLEVLVADFAPLFESYADGREEWLCPLCHQATPATYDPPSELRPAPEPFPHAETCPIAQARALLAMETGKEHTR